MIPLFPTFKKIDLEDRHSIESHTDQYLPYSDFNFTNLWSWDPNEKNGRMISDLHGNLVVWFTDYRTNEPALSFLGTKRVKETAIELLAYAQENNLKPKLSFIVEETALELQKDAVFNIEEDKNNFDYVFSVAKLAKPQGTTFKSKRHLANRFNRENPQAVFSICNFSDADTRDKIVSVFKRWENKKIAEKKSYEIKHEEIALGRLLQTATDHKLIFSCISIDGEMLGFSLDEILTNHYAISHFLKADSSHKGVYEFLNERVAEYLLTRDVTWWNWEQDLNIEGLRQLKMSYRPVSFLKKYKVSLNKL